MDDSITLRSEVFVFAASFPFLAVGWIGIVESVGGTNDAVGMSVVLLGAAIGSVVFSNWAVK